jgi:peptidoglycan DL-endopeptidase CwlO
MLIVGGLLASTVHADPGADAVAKLNELSRQAEQTTEAMHSAQLDLTSKLQTQAVADKQLTDTQAAVSAAQVELTMFQSSVDKVAAAAYMGGHTDDMAAILTADTPQGLIDKLAVQRVMAAEMSAQLTNYRQLRAAALQAKDASAKPAAEARTAAGEASKVRAELQARQTQLQVQIAVVKSQYGLLSPPQRAALAALVPVPAARPAPAPAPAAEVLAAPPVPAPEVLAAAPVEPVPDAIAPPEVPVPDAIEPSFGGAAEGAIAVQAALTRVGAPYSWGAAGPGAFDCSGLVMWAFQQAGISLPHSSQALAAGGIPVSRDQLEPGDVVNYYSDASHTGIYVGDGMVVHASTYGQPVRVVPLDGAGPFYNARRY